MVWTRNMAAKALEVPAGLAFVSMGLCEFMLPCNAELRFHSPSDALRGFRSTDCSRARSDEMPATWSARHLLTHLQGKYISWKTLAEREAGLQTYSFSSLQLQCSTCFLSMQSCVGQAGGGCLSIPLNMFLTIASSPQQWNLARGCKGSWICRQPVP